MSKSITQEIELNVREQTREAHCPNCGKGTIFDFTGVQRWPKRLVEATGCAPVTLLWTCRTCQTTLSESGLDS